MRLITARTLAGGLLAALLAACSDVATAPGTRAAARPAGASFEVALSGPTVYLAEVVSAAQGVQQDGQPVAGVRSDPASALGPSDDDWYSLGFGGVLVAKFDKKYSGRLLISFEQTIVEQYPIEKAKVEVSANGVDYVLVGTITNQNDPTSDVRPFVLDLPQGCWQYVRITDTTDKSLFGTRPDADGFDVNAIAIDEAVACPAAGCSQGYFKNHTTADETKTFAQFGISGSGRDGSTLKSAFKLKGGPTLQAARDILLKQVAAALLNASYVQAYPLTAAEIVAQVNAALATNDRATILALASDLEAKNTAGCPLN